MCCFFRDKESSNARSLNEMKETNQRSRYDISCEIRELQRLVSEEMERKKKEMMS